MNPAILIVEDFDPLRAMLTTEFEKRGFTVHATANPNDGLLIAATRPLDAALTDFELPEKNGLQLCCAIGKQIPVWLMTGSRYVTPEEAQEAGVLRVFRKPFRTKDVIDAIGGFLQSRAPSAGAKG